MCFLQKKKVMKISPKGIAVIAAIDSGLIPPNENGDYDDTAFLKFWGLLERDVSVSIKSRSVGGRKERI